MQQEAPTRRFRNASESKVCRLASESRAVCKHAHTCCSSHVPHTLFQRATVAGVALFAEGWPSVSQRTIKAPPYPMFVGLAWISWAHRPRYYFASASYSALFGRSDRARRNRGEPWRLPFALWHLATSFPGWLLCPFVRSGDALRVSLAALYVSQIPSLGHHITPTVFTTWDANDCECLCCGGVSRPRWTCLCTALFHRSRRKLAPIALHGLVVYTVGCACAYF